MTITETIERLERLNLEQALHDAIEFTYEQYADLNREQWKEGITSTGADIMPAPYSKAYARIRRSEGLQTDFIDLRRKGNYYAGYEISQDAGRMYLTSYVSYEKWITNRFGEKIYGLTEDNMEKYRLVVHPIFMAAVKEQFYV